MGLKTSAAVIIASAIACLPTHAAVEQREPKEISFSFNGVFGTFDRAALQRGYQVYKEVCSNCHSMKLVAFRNLAEPGGPGFSEAQAKELAKQYKYPDFDDAGQPTERAGTLADHFPSPFPNEKAAKASNNGAAPPDLSLMAKAREYGPRYIYSLLTGYGETPPAHHDVPEGLNYNPYFPTGNIAMPPPLSDGQVTFSDGTPSNVPQMAKDVATFLMWTAEPHLEERHEMGVKVMIYLGITTGLLFFAYRKMWSKIDH